MTFQLEAAHAAEPNAGEWIKESEQRLRHFIAYGQRLGYLVGLCCLDGFTEAENQGCADYNFGSRQAAALRWHAAAQAGAGFISTDHYEQLAETLAALKKQRRQAQAPRGALPGRCLPATGSTAPLFPPEGIGRPR
jgi:hypothetical protein